MSIAAILHRARSLFSGSCVFATLVFALSPLCARGADQEEVNPEEPDILAFADGDRMHGKLVRRDGDIIVFDSARFGEIYVPSERAKVIPGTSDAGQDNEKRVAQPPLFSWTVWTSPVVMSAKLREMFGPWRGRFATSLTIVNDKAHRSDAVVEAKLSRKWKKDEVTTEARYEFAQSENATTTDRLTGSGSWRHDFRKGVFATYRPKLEWNRNYLVDGVPGDYVLLQQELGAGLTLIDTKTRKLRVGFSENTFDVWSQGPVKKNLIQSESMFGELEWMMPWSVKLSDRAIWYYSLRTSEQGWENRLDLTKKLTETLSLGLRQEYRSNNPDVRSQDYSLIRFLIGLDF